MMLSVNLSSSKEVKRKGNEIKEQIQKESDGKKKDN